MANEVETADDNPITFASGEPCTLALLIRWTSVSGTQGIFRSVFLEQRLRAIGTLIRQALEISRQLLEEFGDHHALAEQLEVMSELAWWGPDALRSSGTKDLAEQRYTAKG